VLIVDDNATNRRILEQMLGHWRMRPVATESAADALTAMREARAVGEPFVLVLLDAMMPETDGFMLAEEIKRDPMLAGATLMMLSSADRSADVARCRELGLASYLTKPVKQSDLLSAILTALHQPMPGLEAPPKRATPVRAGRLLRILLAEDNVVNQKLALRILEKRGHRVEVAANGREALAALEREAFDLVLMDVQMPELDGLETTAVLREREQERVAVGGDEAGAAAHLPIIALTAHTMHGDRERCLEAGMDGYVSKPIQPAELFAEIERLLPASEPAEEQSAPPATVGPVLDRDELSSRLDGDGELFRELVALFRESAPPLLAQMRAAASQGDGAALRQAAHTLKGSVGNFAARRAVSIAQQLEDMGENGDMSGAGNALAALDAELARVQSALDALEAEEAL
jgi:CheY-like chemotaxis protein/HPt (histidine-containing phosphotransfer) domain-containing protein